MSCLWTHYGMSNTSTGKNPQPLSQQLPFWSFLGSFWPIKRPRSTISQHMLTKISGHVDQTLKLLHLKYYDRTMTRSIKNHFLRCLLPKVPFEINAFIFWLKNWWGGCISDILKENFSNNFENFLMVKNTPNIDSRVRTNPVEHKSIILD